MIKTCIDRRDNSLVPLLSTTPISVSQIKRPLSGFTSRLVGFYQVNGFLFPLRTCQSRTSTRCHHCRCPQTMWTWCGRQCLPNNSSFARANTMTRKKTKTKASAKQSTLTKTKQLLSEIQSKQLRIVSVYSSRSGPMVYWIVFPADILSIAF